MTRLKSQPMPPPTCPKQLLKIVAVLFPQQPACDHRTEKDEEEVIPPATVEELMRACVKVGNTKAPGLDGIPNVALKAAINAAPEIFLDMYNACLQGGVFPEK
ncbi:reverse transcriptase [Lasius niger]|uniref:Reverse transcriptase n=1 Tax=Lasius niger TaxID=67767 RepID=A0A0J7JUM6_LASNI|nr:reverse transcriptase [Lasius niger]